MQSTQDLVKNYYDAAERFLQTWTGYFDKVVPNDPGNILVKGAVKNYSNEAAKALKKSEEYLLNQPDPATLDPEQIRQENLQALDQFEAMYKKTAQAVADQITQQREYMQTDQYLADIEDNKTVVSAMYNTQLSNATSVLNSLTDLMDAMYTQA